jgi:glutamine amidotransferase
MCELFGLSSRLATRATFSLEVFAGHGALGGANVDGWGVACYDLDNSADARLYKEPEPAGDSAWLKFVEQRGVTTTRLVSHIRRASRGGLSLSNTQPFAREFNGRLHVFAHNGDVGEVAPAVRAATDRYHPVGQTDSEAAFCRLLNGLSERWPAGGAPSVADRLAVVAGFAAEMRGLGEANFLYSDGEVLFAHGHRRIQSDGKTAPPGLWWLRRAWSEHPHSQQTAGVHIESRGEEQEIVLFASVPITAEPWRPLAEGEVIAVHAGEVVGTSVPAPAPS